MNSNRSEWQTEGLARTFLEGVRAAIPASRLQLDVVAKIVRSWNPSPRCILDLGCEDGILGRMLLKNFPGSEVCFVDFSEPMIRAVREKTADTPRTMIVQADFTTPEWTQAVPAHLAFDVVVSGFAIHHQTNDRKRELFAEIYHLLVDGGVFLNLEHVASETAAVEAVFDSYFVDHLETFHTSQGSSGTREEIEASYYA